MRKGRPWAPLIGITLAAMALVPSARAFLPLPPPEGQARSADTTYLVWQTNVTRARADGAAGGHPTVRTGASTLHALVLLVEFSDTTWTSDRTPSTFDSLLFSTDGPSVRRYFDEVSGGRLTLTGDVFPIRSLDAAILQYVGPGVSGGIGEYPENAQRLVEDLVRAVDPGVDFTRYDGDGDGVVDVLFVVHAGLAAEDRFGALRFFSHQWHTVDTPLVDGTRVESYVLMSEWSGLGGFAHEMVHLFGIPDLYDLTGVSQGLGYWSLMATGSRLGDEKYANPAHPDPWTRIQLGFLEPITDPFPGMTGSVSLPPVEAGGGVLKVWTGKQPGTEYFLIETRSRDAGEFDAELPGEGLLIYHVDETVPTNETSFRYKVALEQADGRFDLESFGAFREPQGDDGDPFPGSTGAVVFDVGSTPHSRAYDGSPSGLSLTGITRDGSDVRFDLSLADGPGLTAGEVDLTEQTGDGDLRPEAGETWTVSMTVANRGQAAPTSTLWLEASPDIAVTPPSVAVAALGEEGTSRLTDAFTLTMSAGITEDPFAIPLTLAFEAPGVSDTTHITLAGGASFGMATSFESDLEGWTHERIGFGVVDPWHRSSARPFDGGWSAKCGDTTGGSYPDSIDAALVSPPVLLGAGSRLSFAHWMYAEDAEPRDAFDGGRIELSTDGVRFSPVDPVGGYTHQPVANATFWLFDHDLFGGFTDGWQRVSVDLTPWDGTTVWLRFRFASDVTNSGRLFEGWYVDDVRVETDDAPVAFHLAEPAVGEMAVTLDWAVIQNLQAFDGTIRIERTDVDPGGQPVGAPRLLLERAVAENATGTVTDDPLAPGDSRRYQLIEAVAEGDDIVRAEQAASLPELPPTARVLYAGPVPFRSAESTFVIRLSASTITGATARFFDGGGRKLATRDAAGDGSGGLEITWDGSGGLEITWDGRGERGGPLPAGVYFFRVTDPSSREIGRGRVVLVR